MTPAGRTRWIGIAGAAALIAAIVVASLIPANMQLRTGMGWLTEHFLAYFALTIFGASIFYRLVPADEWGNLSHGCLGFVSILQAAFTLLIAPSAIRKAVLRDFTTGMIESHRLSPMSSIKIVGGYMTGPPIQAVWLFGTGLLLGTGFAAHVASQLSPLIISGWYVLQACLLCLAFLVSTLVLLAALASSGKTNVVGVIVVIAIFGGWFVLPFVPGMGLVTGVITGGTILRSIFGMGGPTVATGDAAAIVYAAFGQIVFGGIFLWAACRLVRAPERGMFGMGLGLLLATAWASALEVIS